MALNGKTVKWVGLVLYCIKKKKNLGMNKLVLWVLFSLSLLYTYTVMPPSSGQQQLNRVQQDIPDVFLLDEQKVQPSETTEKQELYVLQWLAQVERESKTIDVVWTDR